MPIACGLGTCKCCCCCWCSAVGCTPQHGSEKERGEIYSEGGKGRARNKQTEGRRGRGRGEERETEREGGEGEREKGGRELLWVTLVPNDAVPCSVHNSPCPFSTLLTVCTSLVWTHFLETAYIIALSLFATSYFAWSDNCASLGPKVAGTDVIRAPALSLSLSFYWSLHTSVPWNIS